MQKDSRSNRVAVLVLMTDRNKTGEFRDVNKTDYVIKVQNLH